MGVHRTAASSSECSLRVSASRLLAPHWEVQKLVARWRLRVGHLRPGRDLGRPRRGLQTPLRLAGLRGQRRRGRCRFLTGCRTRLGRPALHVDAATEVCAVRATPVSQHRHSRRRALASYVGFNALRSFDLNANAISDRARGWRIFFDWWDQRSENGQRKIVRIRNWVTSAVPQGRKANAQRGNVAGRSTPSTDLPEVT